MRTPYYFTANHLPSDRRVWVRRYEVLGGIRSGETRRRAARGRATMGRNLYRKGVSRPFAARLVGVSERTMTNYLNDGYFEGLGGMETNCITQPPTPLLGGEKRRSTRLYRDLRFEIEAHPPDWTCPACGYESETLLCPPCGHRRADLLTPTDWRIPT